jgi:Cof subfamily protein (haloacid dehalogenase superfamily)
MTNKNIKLLALDLDGTTLTNDNTLSPVVKSAIQRAIASGIEVVAASGRPYGSMPQSVLSIEGLGYCISSNGAAIHDKNKRCLHRALLCEQDVLKLLEITKPYDLIFQAYIEGLTYTDKRYIENPLKYGCTEAYLDYVRSAHGQVEDMRKFIFEHRKELDSIEFIETDKALSTMLWSKLESEISGFYITSSTENFVEFMTKEATKANALKRLCTLLGIDFSHTAACGNADNDADMVSWAGLGCAVKNASEKCIKAADIVVASNNDNGVAELIDLILS